MRLTVTVVALCLCAIGMSLANESRAAMDRKHTEIPAQLLAPALRTLAKERNFQIVYPSQEVAAVRSQGATGELTTEEALTQILSGTGLTFRYLDSNTVTIVASGIARHESPAVEAERAPASSSTAFEDDHRDKEGKRNSSDSFRLAQLDQGSSTRTGSLNGLSQGTASTTLSEIVVTAQKREERLWDVPVPVSALSASELLDQNQLRLQDYYSDMPGINLAPGPSGTSSVITIRGLSSGTSNFGNPTTSVTIDDVPTGATASYGGGNNSLVPDIDPSDLARVELLRGPQGTLYGASSLGGLIKYVTLDPSTKEFTAHIQGDGDSVYNGNGLGYGVRAAANIPINETTAIRVSGFTRTDPGYIDNVLTGQSGVNKIETYGGRLSVLWHATDVLSLKATALIQSTTGFGSQYADSNLRDLQQSYIAGTGGFHQNLDVYSLTVKADLGVADLTAISGYNNIGYHDVQDWTKAYGGFFSGFVDSLYGTPGFWNTDSNTLHKFTEEVRLASKQGSKLDWLVGAFFDHETAHAQQAWLGVDPSTSIVGGTLLNGVWPTSYTEYALFADLTIHVTDRFDVQVGGRESENRQTYSEVDGGDYAPAFGLGPAPFITPEVVTKDNAFTYLLTPRFRITPDFMLYARLASGYRAGGPNPNCSAYHVPCHFDPDKTKNYEVGTKGDLFEGKFTVDASFYYINWKDIQLTVLPPGTPDGYFANAGGAKSEGVELSLGFKPGGGLSVTGWVSWDNAAITRGFPENAGAAYAIPGDRLPNSTRISGNLTVEDDFPIRNGFAGFVGGSVSYIGDRLGDFQGIQAGVPLPRQNLPGFSRTDLRLGTKYNSWSGNLFVNNVADKRGVLGGGLDNPVDVNAFAYITPRTIGLSIAKTF